MAQSARKQTQSGRGLGPFYIILGVVGIAGLAWIGYSVAKGSQSEAAVEPVSLTGLEDPGALVQAAQGVSLGSDTAPVQLRVFSDFTCPACKNFAQRIEPQLKAEFVENGLVRLIYHDFILDPTRTTAHRHGFIAARAARCANEQGRFWDYHDVLFGQQGVWAYADPPIDRLVSYAGALSLDSEAFTQCLNSDRYADVVTANSVLGSSMRINQTPTLFIGAQRTEHWQDWPRLREAIQNQLNR